MSAVIDKATHVCWQKHMGQEASNRTRGGPAQVGVRGTGMVLVWGITVFLVLCSLFPQSKVIKSSEGQSRADK